MAGNLVIVESPAKARTIQNFLGEGFTVKSSFGHIRDLPEKKLSVDIDHGFAPEYVIPDNKKKLVAELKNAANKADTVWLASDEDREGEAISWHLSETLGLDKARTRRIVFHEITKTAILNAIKNPRDIDYNLVNAQQARRTLDRLVGFELSPILWRKVQKGLSAGRVQSATLRLVVDREREIEAFKAEPYYTADGDFVIGGAKVRGSLDRRFPDEKEARKFLEDSIGAAYTIADIEKKRVARFPAAPFTTSTLQQEAAAKLHFSLSATMRTAQNLYERGLITYMRTDSTNLSSLAVNTAKTFICDNFGEEYSKPRQFRTKTKGAQEAHEAIRPTYIENTSIKGTPQEQKLYNLIWKRTVASQMADADVLSTSVKLASDKRSECFMIKAQEILFDGFLKLYIDSSEEENGEDGEATLPHINLGEKVEASTLRAECKFTQPPQRYSERTLLKKMEEIGIGRPSTYAPTITTLTSRRGYLVKGDKDGHAVQVTNFKLAGDKLSEVSKKEFIGAEKGKLLPQEIAMIVTDYLCANFPDIMNYDFTATVEKDFDNIAEGARVWNEVISEFYYPFHERVVAAVEDRQFSKVERELGTDPADGSRIVAKFGQYGPFVQKGDGENKVCASLGRGQLIENITLEDALKLLKQPRTVGEYKGIPIVAMKGRYGPYIKYGDKNFSLPRGTTTDGISLDDCIALIEGNGNKADEQKPLKEWDGIMVMNGRYGPYIKAGGKNYKLPAGTDAASLTEEACRKIIAETQPVVRKFKRFNK